MLPKVRNMKKKLFILIMSSALVSGTVANAETATFTDPQFVHIDGIFENVTDFGTSSVSAGDAVASMTPFGPGEVPAGNSDESYRLLVEAKNAGPSSSLLTQVSACIYDSSMFDDSNESIVSNKCGTGQDNPTSGDGTATAAINPQSAIHMTFVNDDSFTAGTEIRSAAPEITENDTAGDANTKFAHKVFNNSGDYGSSYVDNEQTLDDENVGTNVTHIEFRFAPASIANMSSNWKIRVTARYEDDSTVTVTDAGPYTMNFFGGITDIVADQRPTNIDYGTLNPGDTSEQTGIRTGEYVSNSTAEITLAAGAFGKDGSDLAFVSGTPGDGEVKFECGPPASLIAFSGDPIVLYDDQGANSLETYPWLRQDIDDHDCKLTYGSGATGEYSNNMTVAVMQ